MLSSILNKLRHLFRYRFKIVLKTYNGNAIYSVYYKAWHELGWTTWSSAIRNLDEALDDLARAKESLTPKRVFEQIIHEE